jgi:hypothetical protein
LYRMAGVIASAPIPNKTRRRTTGNIRYLWSWRETRTNGPHDTSRILEGLTLLRGLVERRKGIGRGARESQKFNKMHRASFTNY